MTLKRAHFSWLARKAQAAARARRLIALLLLSVFIVLSSASNAVAQLGWYTQSLVGPAPATPVADRCFTGNLTHDRLIGDRKPDSWCTTGTGASTCLCGMSTGTGWSSSTRGGPV